MDTKIEIAMPKRPDGTAEQTPVMTPSVTKEAVAPKPVVEDTTTVHQAPTAATDNTPTQNLIDLVRSAQAAVQQTAQMHPAERVPSNWDIKATADGIEAVNLTTSRIFEGSIAEFNKMIRS